MANKLPAFMFYPADWLTDPVAGCSLESQGLWLRMMILMHSSERYGYLSTNGVPTHPALVAQRCGTNLGHYTTLLAELDRAGVPRRTEEGIIFSKRMVDDEKKRLMYRRNGKKGGNPILKGEVNPRVNLSLKMNHEIELDSEGNWVQGKGGPPEFFELIEKPLRTPAFVAAWADWVQHRHERKPAIKLTAARQQLAKCVELGEERAVAAIRHSIAGSYQGIFEPKNGHAPHSRQEARFQNFVRGLES